MGDNFFKTFFISIFGVLILVGFLMLLHMEKETRDSRQQKNYIESRGRTPIPSSWRDKIGRGI